MEGGGGEEGRWWRRGLEKESEAWMEREDSMGAGRLVDIGGGGGAMEGDAALEMGTHWMRESRGKRGQSRKGAGEGEGAGRLGFREEKLKK